MKSLILAIALAAQQPHVQPTSPPQSDWYCTADISHYPPVAPPCPEGTVSTAECRAACKGTYWIDVTVSFGTACASSNADNAFHKACVAAAEEDCESCIATAHTEQQRARCRAIRDSAVHSCDSQYADRQNATQTAHSSSMQGAQERYASCMADCCHAGMFSLQTPPISECPPGQHHESGCVAECQATRAAAMAEAQTAWNTCYDDAQTNFNACMAGAHTTAQMRACLNAYDSAMVGCNQTKNEAVAAANSDYSACASGCPCVPD